MYNIKLLNKISAQGLSILPNLNYHCGEGVENPDGIIVRSAAMHDMEFGPNLLAIARAGAGTNNIPTPKCSELGICVFNTPGANANAVKELTIMALVMSARQAFPAMQWAQSLKGKGAEVPALVEKGKSNFVGPELKGKALGVIGLGTIGVLVSNLAVDMGMEVHGYDPYMSVDAALKLSKMVKRDGTLKDIYTQCDYITLHLPSIADTRGMINAETLAMTKKGVRILNFSRGDLVESSDMLAALEEGQVGCYVTDFPDDSLLCHPGVLALPHLGASTPESEENCAIMAAHEIRDYLEHGNITNSINLPGVSVPRSERPRICIIHKNVAGVLKQITGLVGANINNATNDSRGDLGYIIMDLDAPADADLIEEISAMPEVIRVRYLK